MRFTKVELHNFMSYEDQELDIAGLDYAAISGRNGSGKSSIALAIAWALYGTMRVKGDSDSVVRDGAPDCSVALEFSADGALWRIERSKKRATKRSTSATVRLLSQDAEGQWVPYGDHLNATAQTRIEQFVGMSEDAFYSLVLLDGQSGVRFVNADSAKRRDILMSLLPELSAWSERETTAREMLATDRASIAADEARLDSDIEQQASIKAQLADLQSQRDEYDEDDLRRNLHQIQRDIAGQRRRLDDVGKEEQDALDAAKADFGVRTRELTAAETVARSASREARERLLTGQRLLSEIDDIESGLKGDRQAVTAAEAAAKAAVEAFDDLEAKLKPQIADLREREQDLREQAKGPDSLVRANERALGPLTRLQDDHAATCPMCQTDLDHEALDSLAGRLQDEIDQARKEIESLGNEADETKRKAQELQDELDDCGEAADAAEADLERAKETLGKHLSALESKRDEFDDLLQRWEAESFEDVKRWAADAADALEAAQDAVAEHEKAAGEKLSKLEAALAKVRDSNENEQLAQGLRDLLDSQRDLQSRVSKMDQLSGSISARTQSLTEVTDRIRERQASIRSVSERIDAMETVVAACRPQGIPSMLLDGVLAPIENEATKILNGVPGGEGMALRFEQARALKSRDGSREVLDIVVTLPTGAERPIESLSAGERVRVSLALVFAMIAVLGSRRGGDSLDTVFLDEPLGPLDQEAVPAFVQVLRTAVSSGTLSSVLVVTHDQRIIDALPQHIAVEREESGVSVATVLS